jgi:N-acyl-phosphatidylethanolamine-hydrolysing phospholipase D
MRLIWVGGPTARIEIGSFRILTDPMLGEGPEAFIMRRHPSTGALNVPIERLAPLPSVDLDDLDMVIASHLHSDHFDTRAIEQLNKQGEIVAPTAHLPQLRDWGFGRLTGLEWHQERIWSKNGEQLRVLALPAHHAHDEEADHELGVVNGYLIEHHAHDSTFASYWTGDTVWFDALAETAEKLPPLDLLLPHMGGVGKDGGPWGMISLDAVEGARVVELTNPDTVIPIHHSTFSFYVEPISEFATRLTASRYTGLVILAEGEAWKSD